MFGYYDDDADDKFRITTTKTSTSSPQHTSLPSLHSLSLGSSPPGRSSFTYDHAPTNGDSRDRRAYSGSGSTTGPSRPSVNRHPSPSRSRAVPSFSTSSVSLAAKDGVCGLMNLANTCYMNSVLQCLASCTYLAEYFRSGMYKDDLNVESRDGSGGKIAVEFSQLLSFMYRNNTSVTPSSFVKAVQQFASEQFEPGRQNDAHDFLVFLLDVLNEDTNRVTRKVPISIPDCNNENVAAAAAMAWDQHRKNNRSVVADMFRGLLASKIRCPGCKKVSVTFDPFFTISVPLPEPQRSGVHRSGVINMMSCFEEFFKAERLGESEKWHCSGCKKYRQAEKQLSLCVAPLVLVVHLKRFSSGFYSSSKIHTDVDFPIQRMDLTNRLATGKEGKAQSAVYNLFGIVHHIGTTNSGHYTAACGGTEREGTKKWYKYDDSDATQEQRTPQLTPSSQAYLLFYAKVAS